MTPEERAALKAEYDMLSGELARRKRVSALDQSKANIAKDQESYNPTNGMSALDKFGAGAASGVIQGVKGVGNLLGLVSDESVKEQKATDQAVNETGWGTAGNIVGSGVLTAPLGGAWGAGAKALGALPRAAKALQLAGRVGSSTPARAAVEGALTGAIYADPDSRGEDAWTGAAFGAGLGVGGKMLGRGVKGLATKSQEAEDLATHGMAHGKDLFAPVAQAVDDKSDLISRGVKSLYKEALPYMPGVTAQFNAQTRKLGSDFREISLREADQWGVLTPDLLKKPQEAVRVLRKKIDDEMKDTVKQYDFIIPDRSKILPMVERRVKTEFPEVDKQTIARVNEIVERNLGRFSDNFDAKGNAFIRMSGENLMEARNTMSREIGQLTGREKQAAVAAHEIFDDMIKKRLQMSGISTHLEDLARYEKALDAHRGVKAVEGAVKKAAVQSGEYSPAQLIRASKRDPTQTDIGQTFQKVTSNKIGLPGAAGRWIARAATLGTAMTNPVTAAVGLTAGNLLATKPVQSAILGDTRAQQMIIEALRKNPKLAQALSSGLRGGLVADTEQ